MRTKRVGCCAGLGILALLVSLLPNPAWSAAELRIGYMAHPIQENSIKWLKKWGEENKVIITAVPVSYEVYIEKMTANLTSGGDQYDVIWHNDDGASSGDGTSSPWTTFLR